MRVLFIIRYISQFAPMGVMLLSSILKQNGHEAMLAVIEKGDVRNKIESFKPDMLAYSIMTPDISVVLEFNKELRKDTNIFTLAGGVHATVCPEIVDEPGFDAVCVGEGEKALLEVLDALKNNAPVQGIPNIITSSDQTINLRPLLADLDANPFMDRKIVKEYPEMRYFPVEDMCAGRGCAYRCPYCHNNTVNAMYKGKGKIVRRRSVDSVITEAAALVRDYDAQFIRIYDDCLIYGVDDWIKEFAERWPREVKIPFFCLLRAEHASDELADLLKQAGCKSVSMSIEAANDVIRNRMLGRKATKQQIEDGFKLFQDRGIAVYANTMMGLPFTSIEHDIESLDFNIKTRAEMTGFSIFQPFPRTALADFCQERGYLVMSSSQSAHYGDASSLSCFSDEEKRMQFNLCSLAPLVVKFPFLRNVVIRHLLRRNLTAAIGLVGAFVMGYSTRTKIYPVRYPLAGLLVAAKSIVFGLLGHMLAMRSSRRGKGAAAPPSAPARTMDAALKSRLLEDCMHNMEMRRKGLLAVAAPLSQVPADQPNP